MAVGVVEGRALLKLVCVMEALVCQHLLPGGRGCNGKVSVGHCICYLSFIIYHSWAPSQCRGTCPGTQGSVTPQSKSANFFLSARKFGFKGVVWGLMLGKKSPVEEIRSHLRELPDSTSHSVSLMVFKLRGKKLL